MRRPYDLRHIGENETMGKASDPYKNGYASGSKRAVIALVTTSLVALGCAPNIYKMWDSKIETMHSVDPHVGRWHRKGDISLLLGGPPSSCEAVAGEPARFGLSVSGQELMVNLVMPGSPAANAGIRVGDRITSIDSVKPVAPTDAIQILRQKARRSATITITTTSAVYSLKPQVPLTEQCYWNVSGGAISRTGAYGGWTDEGGSAAVSGAAYSRFYKLTCRFQDGWLVSYASNWQW